MKALLTAFLALASLPSFAHAADNTLEKYADKAIACVKQLGYANPQDDLSVIELDPASLRIEFTNHPPGTSGFVANMDIVDGSVYYLDPVTMNLIYCN